MFLESISADSTWPSCYNMSFSCETSLQIMDKLFPDVPINSGLAKGLALLSDGVSKAAQTLVSLSFLVLPVSLAIGIKLFQWLGPFAAAAAVLIPLGGLFAAESILSERSILPLSGEGLVPYTTGKAVRNLHHQLTRLEIDFPPCCIPSARRWNE